MCIVKTAFQRKIIHDTIKALMGLGGGGLKALYFYLRFYLECLPYSSQNQYRGLFRPVGNVIYQILLQKKKKKYHLEMKVLHKDKMKKFVLP